MAALCGFTAADSSGCSHVGCVHIYFRACKGKPLTAKHAPSVMPLFLELKRIVYIITVPCICQSYAFYDELNDIDLKNKIAAVRHENANIFHSVTIPSVTVSIETIGLLDRNTRIKTSTKPLTGIAID